MDKATKRINQALGMIILFTGFILSGLTTAQAGSIGFSGHVTGVGKGVLVAQSGDLDVFGNQAAISIGLRNGQTEGREIKMRVFAADGTVLASNVNQKTEMLNAGGKRKFLVVFNLLDKPHQTVRICSKNRTQTSGWSKSQCVNYQITRLDRING